MEVMLSSPDPYRPAPAVGTAAPAFVSERSRVAVWLLPAGRMERGLEGQRPRPEHLHRVPLAINDPPPVGIQHDRSRVDLHREVHVDRRAAIHVDEPERLTAVGFGAPCE